MQNYPNARDAYEKVLSIQPNFVPALNNLAYLYTEHMDNLDKAYELASKARGLLGDDASVGDTFGWVLYKRGDYEQALAVLEQSAERGGDSADIHFHLGMTAFMIGQTDLYELTIIYKAVAAGGFM